LVVSHQVTFVESARPALHENGQTVTKNGPKMATVKKHPGDWAEHGDSQSPPGAHIPTPKTHSPTPNVQAV